MGDKHVRFGICTDPSFPFHTEFAPCLGTSRTTQGRRDPRGGFGTTRGRGLPSNLGPVGPCGRGTEGNETGPRPVGRVCPERIPPREIDCGSR
eukprot:scaffold905_cov363-Pavlova_lutheri.AAC.22